MILFYCSGERVYAQPNAAYGIGMKAGRAIDN